MYLYIEEWKKFRLLLKFFYVVPQSAIILDDSLLRNARIFIKNDNLIWIIVFSVVFNLVNTLRNNIKILISSLQFLKRTLSKFFF